ncbi:short-chain dehydrogenase [Niabella sp. CC-SYL272]|uniref:short-chain dehydrogenase n=1 Tax=Niabella agricola TaxID=2891571 RepID=UPI001F27CF0E|nr:short-chain dehydrogenase [Niabella agricola]MCF3110880.1 short-chain dehydrogenase [Niabella agricola]
MDVHAIEKFLASATKNAGAVNIHFKDRSTVTGIFISSRDYEELKAKNFWRVVSSKNLQQWERTRDVNLSRLFSGSGFTRLSAAAK